MQTPRIRWLRMLALAAIVPLSAWILRPWLRTATVEQLGRQYEAQIAALPERDAAQLVRRLAQDDTLWLAVLVAASNDERPRVAAAAQLALREMVDRWAALSASESSSQVGQLAAALATHAADVPPGRRHFLHSLAQRLIDWPIDGQRIDAAKFIANCEAVLVLLVAEDREIRVAATIARPSSTAPAEPPPIVAARAEPMIPQPSPPPQEPGTPAPIFVEDPVPLTQGNQGMSIEPKQFLPPKAMRISDE